MYRDVEALLLKRIGLDARSLGDVSVPKAIERRMAEIGIDNIARYEHLIETDRNEMDALIEMLVVPETWFFRGGEAFEALKHFVMHEWLQRGLDQPLRILSLPCSTGEEPYSIAMALLDTGLDPSRFHIDAVDISQAALIKAQHACYGSNSFRGEKLDFRSRYFHHTDAGYRLHLHVEQLVNFSQKNILDEDFTDKHRHYDVIFCRNLLIYFDDTARNKVTDLLLHLLAANGLLFLGHADNSMRLFGTFVSTRYPMTFSYRKRSDDRRSDERTERRVAPILRLQHDRRSPVQERRRFDPEQAKKRLQARKHSSDQKQQVQDSLEQASLLANAGKTDESESLCEAHLEEHGPSAQAYFLLAMIENSRGEKGKAAHLLRKVIYLEPNHYQALVCLSIIMDEEGHGSDAKKFRQRSERVLQRQATA